MNMSVILEPLGGPHSLSLGDYYFDETLNVLYVGVGDFGSHRGAIVPTGTIYINAPGNYDIASYARAIVSIISPEGELDITENGQFDVTEYASVNVNVEPPHIVIPYQRVVLSSTPAPITITITE